MSTLARSSMDREFSSNGSEDAPSSARAPLQTRTSENARGASPRGGNSVGRRAPIGPSPAWRNDGNRKSIRRHGWRGSIKLRTSRTYYRIHNLKNESIYGYFNLHDIIFMCQYYS